MAECGGQWRSQEMWMYSRHAARFGGRGDEREEEKTGKMRGKTKRYCNALKKGT